MDPVASKITEKFAEQSIQQAPAAPGKVDAGDQMRFEQALSAPQDPAGAQGIQQVDAQQLDAQQVDLLGQPVEGQVTRPTLGDAILDGIEKLKTNHDVRAERIEQTIAESGGEMSVEQMMKLQFEVMQMGIEQDITAKMADKTSQGVQTLFRNQS